MVFFAAPVIVTTCWDLEETQKAILLSLLVSAFPLGTFLGPLWATLGRRWGMKQLVVRAGIVGNSAQLLMFWVSDPLIFTLLAAFGQLMYTAMRLGQSSNYHTNYAREAQGRAVGRLIFLHFVTMVPTVLFAGWISHQDRYPDAYQLLYPASAPCGLLGCWFYSRIWFEQVRPARLPIVRLREKLQEVGRVVRDHREYMAFQLAFFLSGASYFMAAHVALLMAHERLGFDATALALWFSVIPQVVLCFASPVWGRIVDRFGIWEARRLVAVCMTTYLACYFISIWMVLPGFIMAGALFRGMSEGGGQVTWSLAPVQFAPSSSDVALYGEIHFFLNGVRGLMMPWIGSLLYILTGPWTLLVAVGISGASIFVCANTIRGRDLVLDSVPDLELVPVPAPLESNDGPVSRDSLAV